MIEAIELTGPGGGLPQWTVGLAAFAFVSSITPGPNNILLAASGARFGARRTAAHALGIWAGMVTLLLLAMAGVGALSRTAPSLALALQILAAGALVVTAMSLVRDRGAAQGAAGAPDATSPWSFWQGLGFQYLNPKAVMMAATAAAMMPQSGAVWLEDAPVGVGLFMTVSMPCTWAWVLGGAAMRRTLDSPARKRVFNMVMAGLLLATIPLSFVPAAA